MLDVTGRNGTVTDRKKKRGYQNENMEKERTGSVA